MADRDAEKRAAAEAAAELVRDGDKVGLGTGSTVAPMLPALAARKLNIRCVATSIATEVAARALGIEVEPFEQLDRLDIAIDGADQIDPDGWLVKGGGGAHTREKVVAAAADALRRDRVVGQGRRPDRGADPARAAGVRAAGDAAAAGLGRAAARAALARRRRDRRLPRRGPRPRLHRRAAVGHARGRRPRPVRPGARQRRADRARLGDRAPRSSSRGNSPPPSAVLSVDARADHLHARRRPPRPALPVRPRAAPRRPRGAARRAGLRPVARRARRARRT